MPRMRSDASGHVGIPLLAPASFCVGCPGLPSTLPFTTDYFSRPHAHKFFDQALLPTIARLSAAQEPRTPTVPCVQPPPQAPGPQHSAAPSASASPQPGHGSPFALKKAGRYPYLCLPMHLTPPLAHHLCRARAPHPCHGSPTHTPGQAPHTIVLRPTTSTAPEHQILELATAALPMHLARHLTQFFFGPPPLPCRPPISLLVFMPHPPYLSTTYLTAHARNGPTAGVPLPLLLRALSPLPPPRPRFPRCTPSAASTTCRSPSRYCDQLCITASSPCHMSDVTRRHTAVTVALYSLSTMFCRGGGGGTRGARSEARVLGCRSGTG